MFSQIKIWLYGIGAGIVALFVGWFKYRGYKIEQQEQELEERQQELQAMNQYHADKDKVQAFEHQNDVAAAKTNTRVNDEVKDGSHSI